MDTACQSNDNNNDVTSSNGSSFMILSHPGVSLNETGVSPGVNADREMLAADQFMNNGVQQSTNNNPKSLQEITSSHAAANSMPVASSSSTESAGQRNCLSLTNDRSIGEVLTTVDSEISIDMKDDQKESKEDDSMNRFKEQRKISQGSQPSSSFDMFSFEMVLKELRLENERLKEMVDNNNAAMRRQLSIVQNWQREVKSSKQAYDDLKKDTESEIENLKRINEQLRQTIESNINEQMEKRKLQEDDMTQTGDSLQETQTVKPVVVTPNLPITPYAGADGPGSGYYWDDMSYGLDELRSRLDRMNEQTVVAETQATIPESSEERDSQADLIAQQREEIKASKEIIERMEQEVNQLKGQVINGSADSAMIKSLQSQVKIFMQSYADEQKRSQELANHVQQLLDELQALREEKLELELKVDSSPDSSPNADRELEEAEAMLEQEESKHHRHRHEKYHQKHMRHHHRHRKDKKGERSPTDQGSGSSGPAGTTDPPLDPPVKYLKKLARAHVANLTSGIKLKSFKDFTSSMN